MKKYIINTIIALSLANPIIAQVETTHPDEATAFTIGDQKTYTFLQVGDKGENTEEVKGTTCLPDNNFETHATWLKLSIAEKGTLAFDITPLDNADDFDFIVFRYTTEDRKEEIRCMAAGEIIGAPSESANCRGVTGLINIAKDNTENKGCAKNKDNFLAAINTQAGEKYTICINNFASQRGFQITFTGTATIGNALTDDFIISECIPNPTKQNTSININAPTQQPIDYILVAANGQILSKHNTMLYKGKNQLDINTESLPVGAYRLLLQTNNTKTERHFIKQ